MEPVSVVYFVLFLIGFCFAVISFILSSLGHFGGHLTGMDTHGIDSGGHDIGTGQHDTSGHASSDLSDTNISPVSPITIAMFITAFGGVGFIFQQIPGGNLMLSLPLAFISGFVIAGAAFYILYRLFKATQANSNYSRESLLGLEAEVITSIPSDGLGEIAYITKGSRSNAPARSEEHNPIPTHSVVRMTRIVGNIFYVREIPEELLRKYDDELKELEDTN
ncbi:MAG: NfeD family protein [Candidatus Poribacteria bacterium]